MSRFRLYLVTPLLGVCILLLGPTLAEAQGRGGSGRGGGGGGGGGGGRSVAPSGRSVAPASGRYHGPGPGSNYHGQNYHGQNYYHHNYHGNYYPGFYGFYYAPFGFGFADPWYDNSFYPPSASFYPPPADYGFPYPAPLVPPAPPEPVNQKARIEVLLPTEIAQVWIGGYKTSTTGTRRTYFTPELAPGYTYSYDVAATWMQGGQEVRVERTIRLVPGQTTRVDFSRVDATERMPPVKD